jgi:hypothetical protein
MVDEFRLDEQMINDAIDLVKEGGESEHRLLYHILTSLREMGYRWRSEYKVVLLGDNELEAEYETDYANYLDLKSQRRKITWEQYKELHGIDSEE